MIAAYLTFNGNAAEAFDFYKSVLGGEFTNFQRFGDTPHAGEMPEEDRRKVMHVTLETADGSVLMGNDYLDFTGEAFSRGNNVSLSIHPPDPEEARRVYESLARGGEILMPLEKVFWGGYFGMCKDRFGLKWLVNCQSR